MKTSFLRRLSAGLLALGLSAACVPGVRAQSVEIDGATTTLGNVPAVGRSNIGAGNYVVPLDYDKLCDGTQASRDCSTATKNMAAATVSGTSPNVKIQAGSWYWAADCITLKGGQTLLGDGRGNTLVKRDQAFNPACAGAILLTGAERASPTVQGITLSDTEPTANTASLTSAAISGTALTATIASGTPANGNLLTGTGVTWGTTLSSVSIVGSALTATVSISQTVGSEAMTTGLGRTNIADLGVCDAVTTLCNYSPFIVSTTANRFKLKDIMCSPCWNFYANTAGNPIGGFFIEDIEMGSLNVGLNVFSVLDTGHIARVAQFPFGSSATALQALYRDGANYAAKFGTAGTVGGITGEVDNLVVDDFSTLNGRIQIDNTNSWVSLGALTLDSTNSLLDVVNSQWTLMDRVYGTGITPSGKCKLNFASGQNQVNEVYLAPVGSFPICVTGTASFRSASGYIAGPSGGTASLVHSSTGQSLISAYTFATSGLDVSGGTVLVSDSVILPQSTGTRAAQISAGVLSLSNTRVAPNTGAGAWTVTLFNQTGGVLRGDNIILINGSPGDVGAFSFTDSASNKIVNSDFSTWGYTPPAGTLGTYWPNGPSTYTVAALPTCNASQDRNHVTVTDQAASPVYGAAPTGGGSLRAKVGCTNGTGWRLGL